MKMSSPRYHGFVQQQMFIRITNPCHLFFQNNGAPDKFYTHDYLLYFLLGARFVQNGNTLVSGKSIHYSCISKNIATKIASVFSNGPLERYI